MAYGILVIWAYAGCGRDTAASEFWRAWTAILFGCLGPLHSRLSEGCLLSCVARPGPPRPGLFSDITLPGAGQQTYFVHLPPAPLDMHKLSKVQVQLLTTNAGASPRRNVQTTSALSSEIISMINEV